MFANSNTDMAARLITWKPGITTKATFFMARVRSDSRGGMSEKVAYWTLRPGDRTPKLFLSRVAFRRRASTKEFRHEPSRLPWHCPRHRRVVRHRRPLCQAP